MISIILRRKAWPFCVRTAIGAVLTIARPVSQARNRNDRKGPVSTGLRTREAMMRELPSLLDSM